MSVREIAAETPARDALPGRPGKRMAEVWHLLGSAQRKALWPHIIGDTSAEYLSILLTEEGFRIGATSIKSYRRSLRQDGV